MLRDYYKQFSVKSVFFRYVSSSFFGSLIGIFTGFFTYRYIEPSLLGIWTLFTIYEVYANFSRLGIINGLGRELPYLLGKGDTESANIMASTSLYYSLISNLLLFVFVPIILFTQNIFWADMNYVLAFIIVIAKIIMNSYTSYLSVTFRTSKNFNDLTRIQNILSILRLCSLVLVIFWGFIGLILRELILSAFEMYLFHNKRPLTLKPVFNKNSFFKLFKVGFPLFLVSYVFGVVETFPRLYIVQYGTIEELGLFSPVIIMLGLAMILPNAISSYMYPKMSFEFGQHANKANVWRIVILTAFASLITGIPMFFGVYFFADHLLLLFPKYKDVIPCLKIASLSLLFIGYKSGGLTFAVLKSWKAMVINALMFFFISLISLIVLSKIIKNVLEVSAWSLVISYGFMFLFSLLLSFFVTKKKSLVV